MGDAAKGGFTPRHGLVAAVVLMFGWVAWNRRWMTDDGYINIRVVEQWLAGNGAVFNAGERVEVATSTLWLWLIALPSAVLPVEPSVIAVVLGWICAVSAAVVAALGSLRFARRAGLEAASSFPLPLGLLVMVGITQFSDFATSGLENGLTWLWMAVCFFGLAGHIGSEAPAHRPLWLPVVLGLGWLVRPDAALYSAAFLCALIVMSRWSWRGLAASLGLAAVLPVAYQVFRMGYYATAVPNTALAKNADGSLWSFGLNYLWGLVRHYALVVPIAILLLALVVRVARLVRDGRWQAFWLLGATIGAALLHVVYITKVGGDFMFGRFLLAPIFAMILPLAVIPIRAEALRSWVGVGTSTMLVWTFYAGGTVQAQRFHGHGVQDERFIYTGWVPSGSTLRPWEWAGFSFYEHGFAVAKDRDRGERYFQEADGRRVPVADGYDLVYTHNVMGIVSVVAGTEVMVIDNLGLADPLAARMPLPTDKRVERVGHMGHPAEFRIARYAAPAPDDSPQVQAARRVLECGDVARLQRGISDPLTPRLFWSNVVEAPRLTMLQIPRDPIAAEEQLCDSDGVEGASIDAKEHAR